MNRLGLFAVVLLALALPGHSPGPAPDSHPRVLTPNAALSELLAHRNRVELPNERLRRNWTSPIGSGSCMHASVRHLLHWQGTHELADWWGQRYSGGETFSGLCSKLSAAGVDWIVGIPFDQSFLERACIARRGAVVTYMANHAVALVDLDNQFAYVLDPNSPQHIVNVPRDEFVSDWISRGGMALTPLAGSPLPPSPWLVTEILR